MLLITKHVVNYQTFVNYQGSAFLLKWGGETHGTKLNIICILLKGII